jgi:holliday junction DNA helicase RuvA
MRPECVAVESLFYAANARSALRLGHARGVAILAAVQAGCDRRGVHAGRGEAGGRRLRPRRQAAGAADGQAAPRASNEAPSPHDAADALAVAICHVHRAAARRHVPGEAGARRPGSSAHGCRGRGADLAPYRPPAQRMIAFLRGRLLEKQPNACMVDVQGSATRCTCRCRRTISSATWAAVSLRIHTHVREDALQLYGFLTDAERQVFERLIGVSGIGPRLAIAVLSGMEAPDLVAAVQGTATPRASRRFPAWAAEDGRAHRPRAEGSARADRAGGAAGPAGGRGGPAAADLVSALQNLGYHRPQAEKAVDAILCRPTLRSRSRRRSRPRCGSWRDEREAIGSSPRQGPLAGRRRDAQYEAGLRPRALAEYIGQDRVRDNLQVSIAAAGAR